MLFIVYFSLVVIKLRVEQNVEDVGRFDVRY
jgi:hypothetical protein